MQRPDPRAFRQHLRTLARPSLRPGEKPREGARHLALSRLDRAQLALRQMGTPTDQQSLAHKELVSLQHKRRAVRCLRDDLWRWVIGEVKKAAGQRECGDVPYEVGRALVECWRNRSDTRFHMPHLWDLWPLPLQQLEQAWDEMYADEFSEVSDSFARPGDLRWDTLYTVFTTYWLTHPSPYMKTVLGLPDIPASASLLPMGPNLNHPTRRGNKPRAGKRAQFSFQGQEVGAAQAPARTHSVPSPADSQVSNTPKMCQRAIK